MINAYWEDAAKTIIRLDYVPPINSWDEYDGAVLQAIEMVRSVDHTVYIIHNAGKAQMPSGSPIPHLRKAMLPPLKNCGMMISVIEDIFARNMVTIVTKVLFRGTLRIVGTLDEAYLLIEQNEQHKRTATPSTPPIRF